MQLTSDIHELAQRDGVRKAQETIWDALPQSTRDNYFKFKGRQSCIKRAMAVPLPGAAGDAFLRGSVKIEDYTIYEVMPIHLKCLQLVNSPLLDLITSAVEDGKSAKREFEVSDEWKLCFIFTASPETLYDTPKAKLAELIETSAKVQFRAANSALINGICSAIVKQFERHIATTVRYAGEVESQTEKKSSPA